MAARSASIQTSWRRLAKQIAIVVQMGVRWRSWLAAAAPWRRTAQHGMERDRADYMGMLGTVMNCLALQDFLERSAFRRGCKPRSPWDKWQAVYPAPRGRSS